MKYLQQFLFLIILVVHQVSGVTQPVSALGVEPSLYTPITVEFLSQSQGKIGILDETYEPYFSKLQIREIHVLTGFMPPTTNLNEARNFARKKFSSAVTSFTDKEKEVITYVTTVIRQTLQANNLTVIANHPWKFIKIEDWLCGGFAHTRGEYIILSERHLEYLTTKWSDEITRDDSLQMVKKFGSLLVHEQFHSVQRVYPQKFESLYTGFWGFDKVNVEPDSFIVMNQISNPDAPNPEWVTSYNGEYYWVRTLIKTEVVNPRMGEDFMDVVFKLQENDNKFYVARDSLNNLKKQKLLEFNPYVSSFPVSQGLDHPNEISAYMFSKYFIGLVDNLVAFSDVPDSARLYSQNFITWLNSSF